MSNIMFAQLLERFFPVKEHPDKTEFLDVVESGELQTFFFFFFLQSKIVNI